MTPTARTARLACAEWGIGVPAQRPRGVWGVARLRKPLDVNERGAAPSTVAADFLSGLSRARPAGETR